nr:MAG TPA: hypothetical protein [Caudoviricetes sp.]
MSPSKSKVLITSDYIFKQLVYYQLTISLPFRISPTILASCKYFNLPYFQTT